MVSIVIPNYNGRELISQNIPAVVAACQYYIQETGNPCELIVVDDASPDDSAAVLKDLVNTFPSEGDFRFTYLVHNHNQGFSGAMNTGIESAQYPILVSLNSDVRVTQEFLVPLVQHFASRDDLFSVKCNSILPDGTNESIKKIQITKGLVEPVLETNLPHTPVEIVYADAGSCAYDREKLVSLGMFDRLYSPFYFEDFDLGYRACKRGWVNLYEPTSTVYHDHNQTVKKVVKDMNANPAFIAHRDIFNIKNIHEPSLRREALKYRILRFGKNLITLNAPLLKGFQIMITKWPQAIKHHGLDAPHETVSDAELIEKFKIS